MFEFIEFSDDQGEISAILFILFFCFFTGFVYSKFGFMENWQNSWLFVISFSDKKIHIGHTSIPFQPFIFVYLLT